MGFVWLIVVILLSVIACKFTFVSGDSDYKRAKLFENEGKYKEACYNYALAIVKGTLFTKFCRKKVKFIWEQYGPFNYAEVLEEIKKNDTIEECRIAKYTSVEQMIEEIISFQEKQSV